MAIVTAIKEKTQNRTAMKKVMDYVAQDYKTRFEHANGESCKLVLGQNCCGETAFQEFMATKKQYRKESKVYFYQYVQSFKPDCGATPQAIHQVGVELAQEIERHTEKAVNVERFLKIVDKYTDIKELPPQFYENLWSALKSTSGANTVAKMPRSRLIFTTILLA